MNQGTTQSQFLLHASGKGSGLSGFKRLNLLVDILNEMIVFLNGCLKNRCKKGKVFLDRQILIQRKLAGHIPYPLTNLLEIFDRIESVDLRRAASGQKQGSQYAKQRALAGSVGTDDAKELSPVNLKGDVLQSHDLTVTFGNMFYFYRFHHFCKFMPPYIPILRPPSFLTNTLMA